LNSTPTTDTFSQLTNASQWSTITRWRSDSHRQTENFSTQTVTVTVAELSNSIISALLLGLFSIYLKHLNSLKIIIINLLKKKNTKENIKIKFGKTCV